MHIYEIMDTTSPYYCSAIGIFTSLGDAIASLHTLTPPDLAADRFDSATSYMELEIREREIGLSMNRYATAWTCEYTKKIVDGRDVWLSVSKGALLEAK